MTARDAIEARYDPGTETMELTYVGEQQADPERLHVRNSESSRDADGAETTFAQEHDDELSAGDAVEIDAVIGDRVVVMVRTESENATAMRSVAHFSTKPRRAFVIREDGGTIGARYMDRVQRAAEEFRLLVDGEPADRQPADVHDSLEEGSTVELGEFPTKTTITVEWTPPAEPLAVAEHVVPPAATFDVQYDADGGEMRIVHAGGDPIDPEDLSIVAPPAVHRSTAWTDASDADAEDAVEAGDAATYEVDEAPRMLIVLFRGEALYREEVTTDES